MPATDGSSMARGRGTERNPLVGGGGGGGYGATTNNGSSNNDNGSGQDYGRRRHRAVGFTAETLSLRDDKMRRWFAKGGKLEPFRLLKQDARNLRGRWRGDWTLFNQLVLASAVYVFFTNILPGITFASDLYALTGQSWGTVEVVVFSTGLCGVIFSLFSAQPLTILGVTGPFSVLAENLYELSVKHFHVPFLPLMACSDIFSLLNSVIYFHKAYKQLSRIHAAVPFASFLYSVLGAFGTCFTAVFLATAHGWAPLFGRFVRTGLTEYAPALSFMLWIAVPYLGELGSLEHQPPARAVDLVPAHEPGAGLLLCRVLEAAHPVGRGGHHTRRHHHGALLLRPRDQLPSSAPCRATASRSREATPGTWPCSASPTAACGIMGIPPANGLLPQAPLHSESLRYLTEEKYEPEEDDEGEDEDDDLAAAAERRRAASGLSASSSSSSSPPLPPAPGPVSLPAPGGAVVKRTRLVPRVHEQRYSHFLQAALILCFVFSPPFQRLLGLTPTSVLAGLFLFMGYDFPLIIIAFVPIRLAWFGRFWSRETLRYVDAWACRDGKPEDDEEEGDGEFDGSDGVDSFDHDLNRGAGDAVSGRKGHDNLVDLERDAVVTTNGRGGGSSNGRSSNGRRRSGHA
ncbi:hypothetical protein RB596_007119 [Gaeumannomyces avenae]